MPHLTGAGPQRLAPRVRHAALALGLAAAMAAPTVGQANPQGAQVVHGSASFAMPDARTLNVASAPGTITSRSSAAPAAAARTTSATIVDSAADAAGRPCR